MKTGLVFLSITALAVSCGGSSSVTAPDTLPSVSSLKISDFRVKEVTDHSISLEWSPTRGITGYWLSIKGVGDLTLSDNSTSHIADTLDPATSYHFELAACLNETCGPKATLDSSTEKATPGPPSVPDAFRASAVGSTNVSLAWDDVATETYYQIYKNGALALSPQANDVTASVSGLEESTPYTFILKACNANGCSETPELQIETTAPAVPPTPTGFVQTTAGTSSQSVGLKWTDGSGETSYEIYNGTSLLAKTPKDATTRTVSGLASGSTFNLTLRACNTSGCSSSTATTAGTAPAQPGNPAATALSETSIRLSWANVAGETGYQIGWSGGSATVGINITSYDVENLTAGTVYAFTIIAKNNYGQSGAAAASTATWPATPPAAPVLRWGDSTLSSITMAWDTVSRATTYHLQFKRFGTTLVDTYLTTLSYQATGLPSGWEYEFFVASCNTRGCSSFTYKRGNTLPEPPTIFISRITSNSLRINWDQIHEGTYGFNVYWQTSGGAVQGPHYEAYDDYYPYTTLTGLTPNTTYTFWAQACGLYDGCSSNSPSVQAATLP